MTIPYKNFLSAQELFAQVRGEKAGYALQRVFNVTPTAVAEVLSNNVSMRVKKSGVFTASIALTHALYANTTITAEFEITKLPKKDLRFPKLTVAYKNKITKQDIERQVTGTKNGYTLKSITFSTATDVAELTGTGQAMGLFTEKSRYFYGQCYVGTRNV